MLDSGSAKKGRKNPNDPARFIGTVAATEEGEVATMHSYLDKNKIELLLCLYSISSIEEISRILIVLNRIIE